MSDITPESFVRELTDSSLTEIRIEKLWSEKYSGRNVEWPANVRSINKSVDTLFVYLDVPFERPGFPVTYLETLIRPPLDEHAKYLPFSTGQQVVVTASLPTNPPHILIGHCLMGFLDLCNGSIEAVPPKRRWWQFCW